MKFFLIPFVVIVVCWLVKLGVAFYTDRKFSLGKVVWECFWVGKFPSTHAAFLTSSLYLLITHSNDPSVIGFSFVIFLLFMYSLLEDKKREQILEKYFSKSRDSILKKVVSDGTLLDFDGHTYLQLISGVIIGLGVTMILNNIL